MILREHKVIFIHIPKCGGTSIEAMLAPEVDITQLDREHGVGYDPVSQLHLQHATPLELIGTGLVTPEEWNTFFKFTIIRNPWARTVSDYHWLKKHSRVKGKFKDYLLRKRGFANLFESENINHRRDHFYPQSMFLETGDHTPIDRIIRLEDLQNESSSLLSDLNMTERSIPHHNKGVSGKKHYSHYFTPKNIQRFEATYAADLALGYEFEDRR